MFIIIYGGASNKRGHVEFLTIVDRQKKKYQFTHTQENIKHTAMTNTYNIVKESYKKEHFIHFIV